MDINPVAKEAIETLKNTNFKALARSEELGKDFNFKEATSVLELIQQDLIRVSEDASFLRTPKSTEKKIEEIATKTKEFILQINNFAVRGNPQAEEQHRQIHQNIEKLKEDAMGVLPPLIERAEIKKLDPAAIQTQIAQATKSIQEINAIKKEAEKLKDDTALAIKEVRDALGKEGVLISSNDFEVQADHHRDLARYWFWGAVATIIISVFLIIILGN